VAKETDEEKMMKGEDWKVEFDPAVLETMKDDPEMAGFVKDVIAQMRQALDGVKAGARETVNERLEAAGFQKVDPDEVPE